MDFEKIAEDVLRNVFGDKVTFHVEHTNNRLDVTMDLHKSLSERLSTVFQQNVLSIQTEGADTFKIFVNKSKYKWVPFTGEETFRQYIRLMCDLEIEPYIMTAYKAGNLSELPECMETPSVDTSMMSKLSLNQSLVIIAEEYWNSDQAEAVVVSHDSDGGVHISFDMNCGRMGVWRDNSVRITKQGGVSIDVSDTPVEGGDLEYQLKRFIEATINGQPEPA